MVVTYQVVLRFLICEPVASNILSKILVQAKDGREYVDMPQVS
jgi:hypothetical protein